MCIKTKLIFISRYSKSYESEAEESKDEIDTVGTVAFVICPRGY